MTGVSNALATAARCKLFGPMTELEKARAFMVTTASHTTEHKPGPVDLNRIGMSTAALRVKSNAILGIDSEEKLEKVITRLGKNHRLPEETIDEMLLSSDVQ